MIRLKLVVLLTFAVLSINFLLSHGHSHSNEPPHMKYSQQVNEAAQTEFEEEESHGHTHSHTHSHSHSHSHGGHDHLDEEEEHHAHGGCSHGHAHEQDHGHSHEAKQDSKHSHGHGQGGRTKSKEYILRFHERSKIRLWVYSIGSTLLISAFPCFILAFIPIQANTTENSALLKVLLAIGAGGLLGDTFLHLIPHATPAGSGHGHTHSHSHGGEGHSHEPHDLSVGGWVLGGFVIFFIVEKFVRILRGEDGHSHSHSHAPVSALTSHKKSKQSDSQSQDSEDVETEEDGTKQVEKAVEQVQEVPRIRVAAFLNFVADFMHNFTDGLAIGASFIAGSTVGLVTMVTVLVHEIPHEIGDFAILVQSGCSKRKAMGIQLLTALGALFGCVLSLWSVDAYAMAEAAEQSWCSHLQLEVLSTLLQCPLFLSCWRESPHFGRVLKNNRIFVRFPVSRVNCVATRLNGTSSTVGCAIEKKINKIRSKPPVCMREILYQRKKAFIHRNMWKAAWYDCGRRKVSFVRSMVVIWGTDEDGKTVLYIQGSLREDSRLYLRDRHSGGGREKNTRDRMSRHDLGREKFIEECGRKDEKQCTISDQIKSWEPALIGTVTSFPWIHRSFALSLKPSFAC
uniref:Zinc transporter n=1 Tax=Ditylenchus dipsaci TaxID=166011 RepID=A0A915DUD6_9BILA